MSRGDTPATPPEAFARDAGAFYDHCVASDSPPVHVRIVATVALIGYLALAVELLLTVVDSPVLGLVALVAVGVGVPLTWIGATRPRWRGRIAALAALGVLGGVVALVASGRSASELVFIVVTIAITSAAGMWAFAWEMRSAVAHRWSPATRARHGVLLMNTKSGGGKVERFDLQGECARRGIEPVVLAPGDDLRALAEDAVARGADVIGMAGGDGSQAVVAAVASAHDLPFVCVPAGTRNHLALDLGIDRDDVVGSLDAYGDPRQARIDLGEVNGRVFVNNVSLGVYAQIVASDEYRDAKLRTAARMLPTLLGPDAPPSGLHARMQSGAVVDESASRDRLERPVPPEEPGRVRDTCTPRSRCARRGRAAAHESQRCDALRRCRSGGSARPVPRLADHAATGVRGGR